MGHLFHSRFFYERARGTAIIIHRDIAYEPTTVISEPNSRYVIVSGRLISSIDKFFLMVQ